MSVVISTVCLSAAAGAAYEGGRRAMSYVCDHHEDIEKTVKEEINKGWERDYEAGGITYKEKQAQTELA